MRKEAHIKQAFARFGAGTTLRQKQAVERIVAVIQRAAQGPAVQCDIQPLILCRKCKGAGSLNGEPCPRCGASPGTDPESYRGCCDFHEPEPGGAVIVIDPEGGGFRPAGA